MYELTNVPCVNIYIVVSKCLDPSIPLINFWQEKTKLVHRELNLFGKINYLLWVNSKGQLSIPFISFKKLVFVACCRLKLPRVHTVIKKPPNLRRLDGMLLSKLSNIKSLFQIIPCDVYSIIAHFENLSLVVRGKPAILSYLVELRASVTQNIEFERLRVELVVITFYECLHLIIFFYVLFHSDEATFQALENSRDNLELFFLHLVSIQLNTAFLMLKK